MSTDLCVPFPLSRWPIAGAGLVVSSPMVLSSVIVNVAAPDVTGAFGDRAGERPAPDAMVDIRIDVRG